MGLMTYQRRIIAIFIAAAIFAGIMYFVKEGTRKGETDPHEHEAGIIEEHGH